MGFVSPKIGLDAFNCPHCNAYAQMEWFPLFDASGIGELTETNIQIAACSRCGEVSIWWSKLKASQEFGASILGTTRENHGKMLLPDVGFASHPESDMPDDVKVDYIEASRIFMDSPRGAAALLRLALQKLCVYLGEEGKNINNDLRLLAEKEVLSPQVIKVADTLRITGNNAVHPGQMSDADFDQVAGKMFDLLNFIVRKAITEPRELDELYRMTPEQPRKAAEERDARARPSGGD